MDAHLGDTFEVVNEGLNARTTNIDDPLNPHRNAAKYLPACLLSHQPLDLVILMLGTNDTKDHLDRSAQDIAQGMAALVDIAKSTGDDRLEGCTPCPILIVSPPGFATALAPEVADNFRGAPAKQAALAKLYQEVADAKGVHVFDAASVVPIDLIGPDGLHLSVAANQALGRALARKTLEILA